MIGCSNVASLLLARGAIRRREFAIRAALGASRSRLIQQLMSESLILAAVSSLFGLGVTALLRQLLPVIVPSDLALYAQAELQLPVLVFTVFISMVSTMLFGFVPAWQLSIAEPRIALRSGARTEIGHRSTRRIRSALIAGEFALAVILLSGTGLLIRSFISLQKDNLGFRPDNLLVATMNLRTADPKTKPTGIFFEDLLRRVKGVPGVGNAALITGLFSDYTPNTEVITEASSRSLRSAQNAPSTLAVISGAFFKTIGIRVLRGRSFSEYDGPNHPAVAVINKSMADQFWPGQDPIGKRFRYGSPGAIEPEWLTVIGLVADVNPYGPGSKVISTFYRPYEQAPGSPSMDLVARCNLKDCSALGHEIRQAVLSVNRQIPKFAVRPVAGILAQMSASRRFQIWLLGIFSGAALCLAAGGIYGLMSYLVSQRTQEIGLRMALGATERDVFRLVIASGVKIAALGIVLGLSASVLLMRLLRHSLFEVSTNDPLTTVLVSSVLLGAAFAASYFPARAAMKLDPFAAIRHE